MSLSKENTRVTSLNRMLVALAVLLTKSCHSFQAEKMLLIRASSMDLFRLPYCNVNSRSNRCCLHGQTSGENAIKESATSGTQALMAEGANNSAIDRRSAGKMLAASAGTALTVSLGLLTTPTGRFSMVTAATYPAIKIPTWTLQDGVKMPVLALNTVGLSKEDTERAVEIAVNQGMTHIDFHPGPNERDGVAEYLKKHPNSRQDMFLNTKIRKAPPGTSPQKAAERTRQQVEEDLEALFGNSPLKKQVDMLMLRDSPDCVVMQAQWKVLEDALQRGQTRSIGVINFCQSALECLLQTAHVTPAVNYYMLHVGMGRDAHGLRAFGESKGIRSFAYGAVGEPGPDAELLNSPIISRIGQAHDIKSPEEVALRWVLQTGAAASVRPTLAFGLGTSMCDGSTDACLDGLSKRASSFGWSLTDAEMDELDAMTSPDDNPTLFSSAGCPGAFVMPK